MIRKLRLSVPVLGLAVAFGAFAIPNATPQAQEAEFTAAEYPATLTADEVYEEEVTHIVTHKPEHTVKVPVGHVFEVTGRQFMCAQAHFAGEAIEGPAEEITVEPTYSGCGVNMASTGTVPMTVETNGCQYHLRPETHVEANTFEGAGDLTCPPEKGIEIKWYLTEELQTKNSPTCVYLIDPQEFSGVHYENETPNAVVMKFSSTLIWTKIFGGLVCGAAELKWTYRGTSRAEFIREGSLVTGHIGTSE